MHFQLANAFFKASPEWIIAAMAFRNIMTRPFLLKTSHLQDVRKHVKKFKGEIGEIFAGGFKVLAKNDYEILLGADDKHLDFCMSFLIKKENNHSSLVFSLVVKIHNFYGKSYFWDFCRFINKL